MGWLMYLLLIGTAVLFPLIAPAGLLVWLAWAKQPSLLHYLTLAAGVGLFCLFLFMANRWDWTSYWLRYVILASFAAAFAVGLLGNWSNVTARFASADDVLRFVLYAGVAALFVVMLVQVVRGFTYRGAAVDLAFPLRDIEWYVGQGGASSWLNIHYGAGAQSYALDVVALNRFGRRANGILPERLDAYVVFDQPVHAPCSGRVVSAESGLPDLIPPERDARNIAGNHIAIACSGSDVTVILAHLREGSIAADVGADVREGEPIARVGNSGNTTEPHLHIHAVRGTENELSRLLRDAEPVPMRFQGRFLVRNDRKR